MKKALLIIGYFVVFLICVGTLFKLMHWPGAGPMLVIGITFLSAVFVPLFFIQRMIENRTGLSIVVNIFALLTTMMVFNGVMFKVMHWPGGGPMIVLGILLFICPTMLLYVIQQFKEKERKFGEYWRVVVGTLIISLFFFIFAKSPTRNILTTYLNIEEASLLVNDNLRENNQYLIKLAKEKLYTDKNDSAKIISTVDLIHLKSEAMFTKVELLKEALISRVEMNADSEAFSNHWFLGSLDNTDIPTQMFGSPYSADGEELLNHINLYNKEIKELLRAIQPQNESRDEIATLGINVNYNQYTLDNEIPTWHEAMFYQVPVAGALAILTSIQTQALNTEFKAITIVTRN